MLVKTEADMIAELMGGGRVRGVFGASHLLGFNGLPVLIYVKELSGCCAPDVSCESVC
jgi:hypothetical protein